MLLFLEVILACKYPKKTVSSRLEWKKLGRGISFVYYQQALQGKKLGLNEGRARDPDPLINQREQDMADDWKCVSVKHELKPAGTKTWNTTSTEAEDREQKWVNSTDPSFLCPILEAIVLGGPVDWTLERKEEKMMGLGWKGTAQL